MENKGLKFLVISSTLCVSMILTGCGKTISSEAYKSGWNDNLDALQSGFSLVKIRSTSCSDLAKTFIALSDKSENESEFKNYKLGCEDWRKSKDPYVKK